MKVSIIIPTMNKAQRLYMTLLSLCDSTYNKENYEVIVIDDGSDDNTDKVVTKFIEDGRMLLKYCFQQNRGRAAARNRGIGMAAGELVIFLDDDRIVTPDFIAAHVNHYTDSHDDRFVVLGKRMNIYLSDFEKKFSQILSAYEKNTQSLLKYARTEYYWKKISQAQLMYEIKWIMFTTGNASVKRKYLTECGMFNESFQGWGMEDTELGYKLWNIGLDMVMDDEITNYHIEHKRNIPVMLEDEERNHNLFYQLHEKEDVRLYIEFVHGKISLEQFYESVSGKIAASSVKDTYYLKHTKPFQYYIQN